MHSVFIFISAFAQCGEIFVWRSTTPGSTKTWHY